VLRFVFVEIEHPPRGFPTLGRCPIREGATRGP
jgi:hypothetical protein